VLVAGTCVSQDAPLATRNTADFAGIPGLTLIDPFA
jgi:predicted nucleic acid-binding protein